MTTHNFLFKPEILDDEETISCRAENPRLNEKPMVARKTMRIKCKIVTSNSWNRKIKSLWN